MDSSHALPCLVSMTRLIDPLRSYANPYRTLSAQYGWPQNEYYLVDRGHGERRLKAFRLPQL